MGDKVDKEIVTKLVKRMKLVEQPLRILQKSSNKEKATTSNRKESLAQVVSEAVNRQLEEKEKESIKRIIHYEQGTRSKNRQCCSKKERG